MLLFRSNSCRSPVKQAIRHFVPGDYPTVQSAIGNSINGEAVFVRSGTYIEHSLEINENL
jgi:hypothetical protein